MALKYTFLKLGCQCQCRKQKWKNQPIARPRVEQYHWFILPLLLATPTMQFSLDHKRWSHKQNQCSASDSDSFTRLYRSTLLITTPIPSLVKTSLCCITVSIIGISVKYCTSSFINILPLYVIYINNSLHLV